MMPLWLQLATWRNLSRDKSDTLLLLCACLLVILPHTSHLPLWVSAISLLFLGWRALISFSGQRLPDKKLLLALAICCMLGVFANLRTIFGREAGVALLTMLLALKLLEMHARRDLFAVCFLCLFLILTNFLYSQSILTALLMLAALLLILCAQLSFQYINQSPPLKQRLGHSLGIMLMALPLTIVMFFLFPRIQGPLWGMPQDNTAKSGLSDNMSPGKISNLVMSEEVVLRARFYDPPPAQRELYWRGPVFGEFDGYTWRELPWRDLPFQRRPLTVEPMGPLIKYQVTQENLLNRQLLTLDLPRLMPTVQDRASYITRDFQLFTRSRVQGRVRYEAASVTQYRAQADALPDETRNWLVLPPNFNPRTIAHAQEIKRKYSDPEQQLRSILRWFKEENFRYTLQPPLLGRDSVDEFLFNTRAGFCEHYSSSFVVLARALGIPARVVTGYQGGEINPVDGVMTVRQSDAHAWTEVWLHGRGWVRVDPTAAVAPERIEQNLARALPQSANLLGNVGAGLLANDGILGLIRNNFRAMNNAWNQWVLDFNPDKQRRFLQDLGLEDTSWRMLLKLCFGIGSLVMLILLWPMLRMQKRIDPLHALYLQLQKKMAARGLARATHEGMHSWRLRLQQAQLGAAAAAVDEFLQLLTRQTYMRPEAGISAAELQARLKALLKQIS
ncbi:transglutaminaseTgpA domain-containing protein [Massilia sp. W12]|uniref:transglutaminaseTgpA domain-containing protein n=1 Tax=Massilia sp. W12 TaxID=3126507 RepID=UPI0030CF765F